MAASKTRAPNFRSASRASRAAVRVGKASSARIEVKRMFQVKTGIRNSVIPGARRETMVAMKLTEPRVVLSPATTRPMAHRSPPAPGVCTASLSGA
ncbi:hypothetical protein GCM10020000_01030 [Streptomyces olivoverticillatus]